MQVKIIDVAIPGHSRIEDKEREKISEYLQIEKWIKKSNGHPSDNWSVRCQEDGIFERDRNRSVNIRTAAESEIVKNVSYFTTIP